MTSATRSEEALLDLGRRVLRPVEIEARLPDRDHLGLPRQGRDLIHLGLAPFAHVAGVHAYRRAHARVESR
jgi:hypothetical protein